MALRVDVRSHPEQVARRSVDIGLAKLHLQRCPAPVVHLDGVEVHGAFGAVNVRGERACGRLRRDVPGERAQDALKTIRP